MSVKAKFKVDSLEAFQTNRAKDPSKPFSGDNVEKVEMRSIKMSPVGYDANNNENSSFWAASPSGELKLQCINPEAWKQFELGKEYYLTFDPAE